MPPAGSALGRAPKACDLCRRYKARCHPLNGVGGPCLRCRTFSKPCSLESSPSASGSAAGPSPQDLHDSSSIDDDSGLVKQRLGRLESLVSGLESRLEAKLDIIINRDNGARTNPGGISTAPAPQLQPPPPSSSSRRASATADSVPVLLIRDAATDAGVYTPGPTDAGLQTDVMAAGLVPPATARSMMEIFRVHYGRWVKFSEAAPVEQLLDHTRRWPLLLSSIFLIAVRHTSRELADQLAPRLFHETKRLMAASLLHVPQPIEYFQAALVLSLWSTTVGQTPLSIDSWLLTTYAITQGRASPVFAKVLRDQSDQDHADAWSIWNHLCLAHLHYCVGTQRRSALTEEDVRLCVRSSESEDGTGSLGNYEQRMAAEIHLYWTTYQNCTAQRVPAREAIMALEKWKEEWAILFRQPRSQFLQMGYHFSHLLTLRQSLKAPEASMNNVVLRDMIYNSESIIALAMNTTDERTRHLTDHIYHMLVFAALTICQLVKTYEPHLAVSSLGLDVGSLAETVAQLISWLRHIGLPCHAAYMLGSIVEAEFNKTRHAFRRRDMGGAGGSVAVDGTSLAMPPGTDNVSFAPPNMDFTFLYPEFVSSGLFDTGSQAVWPQWS